MKTTKYVFPACFYPEENGQYSVIFPDLGGISTYGNDLKDAICMATDLLCMWVFEAKKDDENLPEPSPVKSIKLDNEDGFVNFIIADIEAYITRNSKSVKKL